MGPARSSPRFAASSLRPRLVLLASLLAVVSSAPPGAFAMRDPPREVDDYHYIFSADCKPYMDWQSVALYRSWIAAGSPGRFTRLLSCDNERYPHRDAVPTHLTPTYDRIDPHDTYAAYNLPGSILHWCVHNATDRRWIVKLDADMIIRRPLSVRSGLTARPGLVAAGYYGYLEGVDNEMAGMFVDDASKRRLARVGGWEIFHADDLRKAAPLWFEFTQKVRQDPRVHWPFKGTGDAFVTEENPRPWISEMYGYVFGTAVAGLRHNVVHGAQLYAGMAPWDDESFDPFLVHYGLNVEIDAWRWDKHDELNGHAPGLRDKISCELPFAPFPTPPANALASRGGATDGKGFPGRRRDDAVAERRRVEVVVELMRAINRGVFAHRHEHCGEPWPRGWEPTPKEATPTKDEDEGTKKDEDEGPTKDAAASLEETRGFHGGAGSEEARGKNARLAGGGDPGPRRTRGDAAGKEPEEPEEPEEPTEEPTEDPASGRAASDDRILDPPRRVAAARRFGFRGVGVGAGPAPADDADPMADAWIAFGFAWGVILTGVAHALRGGSTRGARAGRMVRRRVGKA